jgi:type IV secretory pathway VirB2 component (pilin)
MSYIYIYTAYKKLYMKKIFTVLLLLIAISVDRGGFITARAGEPELVDTSITIDGLVCNVLGFLTGKLGKALAAFACMGVSLAFLAGKVSWTLVLTFTLAMACIFGAPTIIKAFTGGTEAACGSGTSPTSTTG